MEFGGQSELVGRLFLQGGGKGCWIRVKMKELFGEEEAQNGKG